MSIELPTLSIRIKQSDPALNPADFTCARMSGAGGNRGVSWKASPDLAASQLFDDITFTDGTQTIRLLPWALINNVYHNQNRKRFPDGALLISREGDYLACAGHQFELHTTDGRTLRFEAAKSAQMQESFERVLSSEGMNSGVSRYRIYILRASSVSLHNAMLTYQYEPVPEAWVTPYQRSGGEQRSPMVRAPLHNFLRSGGANNNNDQRLYGAR